MEVAQTENFGRAAAALGMPASTLSRKIAALERELGLSLIHRSTRTFKLTDAGKACYEQSKDLVARANRIQEQVKGVAAQAAGHLRVGVPFDLAQTVFLPLFARYMLEYPEITVEVLATSGHPNILTESLDLGIMVGHQLRLPDSSFWSSRIGTFPRRLFAAEAYLRQYGRPEDPSDLTNHLCISLVHGEAISKWELRRGRERRTVKVKGRASANSVGMLASLAREGLGIALLPDFLASRPAFGDGLLRVLNDWEGLPAHVFAITPTTTQPTRVRKLVSFVTEHFDSMLK